MAAGSNNGCCACRMSKFDVPPPSIAYITPCDSDAGVNASIWGTQSDYRQWAKKVYTASWNEQVSNTDLYEESWVGSYDFTVQDSDNQETDQQTGYCEHPAVTGGGSETYTKKLYTPKFESEELALVFEEITVTTFTSEYTSSNNVRTTWTKTVREFDSFDGSEINSTATSGNGSMSLDGPRVSWEGILAATVTSSTTATQASHAINRSGTFQRGGTPGFPDSWTVSNQATLTVTEPKQSGVQFTIPASFDGQYYELKWDFEESSDPPTVLSSGHWRWVRPSNYDPNDVEQRRSPVYPLPVPQNGGEVTVVNLKYRKSQRARFRG